MGFTLEHIHRTINGLGRLMPARLNKNSIREYSLKEAVFLMAPRLLEKREMGCTTNELVKALMNDGIEIKSPTLNRYLCDYQKIHGEEHNANPQETEKKALNAVNSPLPADTPKSDDKPNSFFGQSGKSSQDDFGSI